MHDFAVLFDFDSCVTDISSRLEQRRVIVLYFAFGFVRNFGELDKTRMTRYKSEISQIKTKLNN